MIYQNPPHNMFSSKFKYPVIIDSKRYSSVYNYAGSDMYKNVVGNVYKFLSNKFMLITLLATKNKVIMQDMSEFKYTRNILMCIRDNFGTSTLKYHPIRAKYSSSLFAKVKGKEYSFPNRIIDDIYKYKSKECQDIEITNGGKNCHRAMIYSNPKDPEHKLDCREYCYENTKEWIDNAIKNLPKTIEYPMLDKKNEAKEYKMYLIRFATGRHMEFTYDLKSKKISDTTKVNSKILSEALTYLIKNCRSHLFH